MVNQLGSGLEPYKDFQYKAKLNVNVKLKLSGICRIINMFITLEGIEGAGKTTQAARIAEFLRQRGHGCVTTREPGDTRIGKKIRAILLDPENSDLVPLAELFLYAADRAQHVHERILPALQEGKTVICDRFFDATTVYQGFARGLDLEIIESIHRLVPGELKPDMTILFDLPPEVGLKRAWGQINSGGRTGKESRFEKEALAFHEKVRAGYLNLAHREPDRFFVVDAAESADRVTDCIFRMLCERL